MKTTLTAEAVLDVLASVDDPEYPGVSIVDLGLVERVDVTAKDGVTVDLIPTFLGCPALDYIIEDVRSALAAHGAGPATVRFVDSPVWSPSRISDAGRAALAHDFTVAVQLERRPVACPRCGTRALVTTSMFGSMRCRSVARCESCGEAIELIR